MKYFLDSAIIDEIRYAAKNWKIDGVTTNPRHIKTSGKPFYTVIKEIAAEFSGTPDFPISVEINPHISDAGEMVEAGKKIASISGNFVVKIPCNEQGLTAAYHLTKEGVRCNVTLVFTPSQAVQAARIGAFFVSPFVAWKENNGEDGIKYIKSIVTIYDNYGFETEIIAAAVRDAAKIAAFAEAGVDIVTCAFDVYKESFYSPYTDYGMNIFTQAWDGTPEGTL
jgi:transaldolase